MKKNLLSLALLLAASIGAKAQISAGLNASYTSYGGDVDKATPGIELHAGYAISEKYGLNLSFNYGLPIKETYTEEGASVKSELQFSTIALTAQYNLIGTQEDSFSLYVPVGGAYVLAKAKASAGEFSLSESQSGLTLNAGLGAQFSVGKPFIFAQAGIALPAGSSSSNTRGESVENDNPIPFHTILKLGIKIPFGSN